MSDKAVKYIHETHGWEIAPANRRGGE